MGLSNVMDRGMKYQRDPNTIKVWSNKAIIRRRIPSEKKGLLIIPGSAKAARAEFQGWIHSIGDRRPEDHLYQDLRPGDEVVFSYQVGDDDSKFFEWNDEQFAIIPIEAIQTLVTRAA